MIIHFSEECMINAITCELEGIIKSEDEFYDHIADQLYAQMIGWA